ncbi:MAG TPA: hypothetical protein VFK05_18400 [Polyangiaceae bacterium]|nr:hypothetical protein [Polyangiaceae bacterium]
MACSSGQPDNPNAALQVAHTVGRFTITVDPGGEEQWTIQPDDDNPSLEGSSQRLQTTTAMPAANTRLLGSAQQVTVTGPGTYNPTTHTMSAKIVVTHKSAVATDFDELQMVVTSITSSSPKIAFVTNNDNTPGVGAVMAFADIQSSASTGSMCGPGIRKTSATHALRIFDPDDAPFSFKVDVRALAGAGTAISPDCDGDGFNTEIGEDAGDDCNDSVASVYPGGGVCACAGAGTLCNVPGAACTQTVTSGSTYTCSGPCACNIQAPSTTSDITVNCQHECTFGCNGVTDGADMGTVSCSGTCAAASTCAFNCNNQTGAADCSYSCNNGSTCNVACASTNAAGTDCTTACTDSNCTVACLGGAAQCGATQCNASTCTVSCGTSASSTFSGSCGVADQCSNGSTCNISCVGSNSGGICGVPMCRGSTCNVACGSTTAGAANFHYCGVGDCRNGASCTVACTNASSCSLSCRTSGASAAASCSLDCRAVPVSDQQNGTGDKCHLDCLNGKIKPLGGGLYTCVP